MRRDRAKRRRWEMRGGRGGGGGGGRIERRDEKEERNERMRSGWKEETISELINIKCKLGFIFQWQKA